jgi:DNA-binding PadR family transcriptional regulator
MLLGAGSVYSCLSLLERKGLVRGEWVRRKRMYSLTDEGKRMIAVISSSKNFVVNLINRIFP